MRVACLPLLLVLIGTDASAVGICLEESPNGINGTWNCATPSLLRPNSYVGYSINSAPCELWVFPGPQRGPLPPYLWLVSASMTDPWDNEGPLPVGATSLWLWLMADLFWPDPGATAAEFNLSTDHPDLLLLGVTTFNGVTNASTLPQTLQLTIPDCTIGPLLIAELHMLYLGSVSVEEPNRKGLDWGSVKALYR